MAKQLEKQLKFDFMNEEKLGRHQFSIGKLFQITTGLAATMGGIKCAQVIMPENPNNPFEAMTYSAIAGFCIGTVSLITLYSLKDMATNMYENMTNKKINNNIINTNLLN